MQQKALISEKWSFNFEWAKKINLKDNSKSGKFRHNL